MLSENRFGMQGMGRTEHRLEVKAADLSKRKEINKASGKITTVPQTLPQLTHKEYHLSDCR